MIICLGDSHASVFSRKEKIISQWPKKDYKLFSKIKPIRIGPATAYNLEKKINLLNKILNRTFYPRNSYVLFCFGEVDIRAHLLKQSRLQNKSVEFLVEECVDRYISTINKVSPYRRIRKGVFAPIASWSEMKPYDGPSFGTNLERNKVTEAFNNYLEKKCTENNLVFVSIFEDMLNEDGTTNEIFLDDFGTGIHLNQKSMPLIMKKLYKNGIA
tara:strand:+ start:30077 stop:30718 length:642 start_codon:yes stop_codon:yes gene_type:complete